MIHVYNYMISKENDFGEFSFFFGAFSVVF